jgi:hypothetical protein
MVILPHGPALALLIEWLRKNYPQIPSGEGGREQLTPTPALASPASIKSVTPSMPQLIIPVNELELIKRMAIRDDYRELVARCAAMFLREVEKDPALKNLLERMQKQEGEERILPVLIAGGALTTAGKAAAVGVGLLVGAIAGYLAA